MRDEICSSLGFSSWSKSANAWVKLCTRMRPSGKINNSVVSGSPGDALDFLVFRLIVLLTGQEFFDSNKGPDNCGQVKPRENRNDGNDAQYLR